MVGMLIVTHGDLGKELLKTAEMIKGSLKGVQALSVDQQRGVEEISREIAAAIKKLDRGKGVLILTDLFGGTPSNISLSFLKEGKVEVLTGVNLPMLLKMTDLQEGKTLKELAVLVRDYARKNIYIAGEILSKKLDG